MILDLDRRFLGANYTIGKLYINGKYFCDTLEDPNRDHNRDGDLSDSGESKVYGDTCIPFGTYRIIVTKSPRFKRDLPRLINVPYFEGVLIHRGNSAKHTHGCILLGENTVKGKVVNSTKYELELTKIIKSALGNKENVVINIK